MELPNNAIVLALVFFLGAVMGALLNSLHRAAKIDQIRADFVRELEERMFGIIPSTCLRPEHFRGRDHVQSV